MVLHMRLLALSPLLFLAVLTGCGGGSPTTIAPPAVSAQNVTGNWQIQSGGTVASNAAGVLLLGDLVSSGANVTGTFRFADLVQGNGCGTINQVLTVTGTVDATNPLVQVLHLTSSTFSGSVLTASLILPNGLQGFGTGTIEVKGATCVFASSPAIGSLFPPVNGTYTGTLAPVAGATGASGTASLTFAQATAPSADGQFAVTGAIQFIVGGCNTSVALTGNASGIGIIASSPVTSTSLVEVIATQSAPGLPSQTLNTSVALFSSACSASARLQYSGTLTRQ